MEVDFGKQFSETVRRIVDEKYEGNVFALERSVGLPSDAIRSVIRSDEKRANPKITRAKEICDVLGLEFYIGPPRSASDSAINGFAESAAKFIDPSVDGSPEALRMGYLPIPFGSEDPGHKGAAPIAIARSWLDDNGLLPDNLYFYMVPDNSMAPDLPKDALALLNTRAGRAGHFIWAYSDTGRLRFARLGWPGKDQIMISSNNASQPPALKTGKELETIRPIGRVVWVGHDLK